MQQIAWSLDLDSFLFVAFNIASMHRRDNEVVNQWLVSRKQEISEPYVHFSTARLRYDGTTIHSIFYVVRPIIQLDFSMVKFNSHSMTNFTNRDETIIGFGFPEQSGGCG